MKNSGPAEWLTCSTCLKNPEKSTTHVQSADLWFGGQTFSKFFNILYFLYHAAHTYIH